MGPEQIVKVGPNQVDKLTAMIRWETVIDLIGMDAPRSVTLSATAEHRTRTFDGERGPVSRPAVSVGHAAGMAVM